MVFAATFLAPARVAAQTPLVYDVPFVSGATYDAALPKPGDLLGFVLGSRAATAEEIETCLKSWAAASNRARVVEYARSHENRPLHYMVVTDPQNLQRLDAIQADIARLGDPRELSDEEVAQLIEKTPPVAWLGYTIHGDETEGSDAALAVLYHLLADTREVTQKLLRETIVIIDPLMNPDGRDRFLKMIAEQRGTQPNYDDQSSVHVGHWPRGRGNHYLFDLNRDSILGVHPESRGRIAAAGSWNPLLFVDAHGMGAQDTHLFSPPTEPLNPNLPAHRRKWEVVFSADQAAQFDQMGWLYYNGEWHEEWYPGYTDAWASYRGAIGILYEQARIAEDGVRRPGGRVLTYRESVHHHVVGSLANLGTFHRNRSELWRGFVAARREASDPSGPYAQRVFAVLPTPNKDRWQRFVELMALQGFEMHRSTLSSTVSAADQFGERIADVELPAGTLLIANQQPLGHLLAAMLEFDPQMPESVLKAERKELLAHGQSKIYDTTAWNLTMMYGLEAYVLRMELPASAVCYEVEIGSPELGGESSEVVEDAVALLVDGADDRSVAVAARLMRDGIEVRVSKKPFELPAPGGDAKAQFSRGTLVVHALDQPDREDWRLAVREAAAEEKLAAIPVATGFGPGDLPDLGGGHFVRLEPSRVAVVLRGGVHPYDVGAVWHLLDHRLRLPHARLNLTRGRAPSDLSRYNVLVLPERWRGEYSAEWLSDVATWVRGGGTLIAIGSGARALTKDESKLSEVRTLANVLGELDSYELAIWREWLAAEKNIPAEADVWTHRVAETAPLPWTKFGGARADVDELRRRDEWQRIFMPAGALLGARVDDEHWLTFGCREFLPVMVRGGPVLMSKRGESGVETPVRLGVFRSGAPKSAGASGSTPGEQKERPRAGWAASPPQQNLYLRMSGLLWPEAAQRLANAAYLTRERVGSGQVILFADTPNFRASTLGSARLLMNALVYGPGFGARQPIGR